MSREKNRFSWKSEGTMTTVTDKHNGKSFSYDVAEYEDDINAKVLMFGAKSLFQARASQVDNAEKVAYWAALDAQLRGGSWESERTHTVRVVSAEVEALAQIKDVSVAEIQVALKSLEEEKRAKVLANPAVAKLATTIREKREATVVDLEDLAA